MHVYVIKVNALHISQPSFPTIILIPNLDPNQGYYGGQPGGYPNAPPPGGYPQGGAYPGAGYPGAPPAGFAPPPQPQGYPPYGQQPGYQPPPSYNSTDPYGQGEQLPLSWQTGYGL